MSAASTARRRTPGLDVVAFERGLYTSFSARGIPFFVGGLFDDSDRLVTRSPDEHRERGIAVHTRTEVTAIDLDRRELAVRDHLGDERREGFDQVVLATGADLAFPGVIGTAASKICRYEVARTGITEREAADAGSRCARRRSRTARARATTPAAGRSGSSSWSPPTGACSAAKIVGVEGAAKRIDVLAACIWTAMAVDELELIDLSYAPPYSGVYDPLLVAARAATKAL
jgi:NADPH-dependent 2,4-dienoyl-CoA reductase/sulfur reductase-like enzyme